MAKFDFKAAFFAGKTDEYTPQRRRLGNRLTRTLISLAITLLFGLIYFYLALPALNFKNPGLYVFVIMLCIVFSVSYVFMLGFRAQRGSPVEYVTYTVKALKIPTAIVILMVLAMLIGSVIGARIFRAKDYASLLKTDTANFTSDIAEISFDRIPMLDEDSANNLANRKLGDLSDLVSQFRVNSESSQINYKNRPVRVSFLDYDNFFKWLANRENGIPAYMIIDMVTQEVTVKRLDKSIHYSPSEFFNRDLERHLRFKYPTLMFDDVNFEIDEDGVPYWVASVIDRKIGLFGGKDPVGAVLVNAETGECVYYEMNDIPTWTDRVTSASLIIEQYDYYGKFHNGFWNSLFGQKGCTETTDGYNYIALNDDVWLYTGITSISEDRGNIGFVLVNQRTKESKYYACAGAEEFSAMSSAQGAVQQFDYKSTFPLLLNIENQPTYFMALKDTAGLVKMYGMVNVQQYQIVATGSSVNECRDNYIDLLKQNNIGTGEGNPDRTGELTAKIDDIRFASIDGNTYYYIKLEGEAVYFSFSAKNHPAAILLNAGDLVTVSYYKGEGEILAGISLSKGE